MTRQGRAAFQVIGHAVPRRDGRAKVTGAARYAGDLHFPGMLHGAILRSPYPHARVQSVEPSAALKMPGVLAVLHHGNFTAHSFTNTEWDAPAALGSYPTDQSLFPEVVRYVGEAVAAVAAEDPRIAAEALEAINVSYEPLPAVLDPEAALRPDAPQLQTDAAGNLADRFQISVGDVEAGFLAADQILERRFLTSRQKQVPMEPFTCIASFDGDILTVWTPNQTPHQIRVKLAAIFSLPVNRVRIVTPSLGGGFGARTGLVGEPWAVALALATRRPVRLEYSRYEDFVATEGRHPAIIDVKVGFQNDGTLTALSARALLNTGPHRSQGPHVAQVLGGTLLRPYRCPNRRYEGLTVLTNAPPASAFRGFGGPQACFAIEQIIDEIAERVGKDPLQFRLESLCAPGEPDHLLGRIIESNGLRRCLEAGAETIGWAKLRREDRGRGRRRRGVGLAVAIWNSGTGCLSEPQREASVAQLRLNADGTVNLLSGATDCGTGAGTTLAQIAAEVLGMPVESIRVVLGDTDVTPMDLGARATRTLFVAGLAVHEGALELKERAFVVAADMLEARPEDLEAQAGEIRLRGAPSRFVTYGQVATRAFQTWTELSGRGVAPQRQAPPYAAHFAQVEVDVRTGIIQVIRLVAAHDVGRSIHPLIVEGQIEGGAAQGIGYALFEDMPIDGNGQPLAASLMDYRVPTSADLPRVESLVIEEPDPAGPFGAKGVGEPGIIPTAAAIANAVYHAVGVRLTELPMTPARVRAALRARGEDPYVGNV